MTDTHDQSRGLITEPVTPPPDSCNGHSTTPTTEDASVTTATADGSVSGCHAAASAADYSLLILDSLISGLLIGPLTVLYWRGTWVGLDLHLVPSNPVAGAWICSVVGNVGLVGIVYAQRWLSRRLRADNKLHWLVGYHLYTYVFGFFNICHWRGLWVMIDCYGGINGPSAWICFAVGQLGLWLLRSSKNTLAPPMIVLTDVSPDFFVYSTRFKTKPEEREKFFLDTLLTVFVVHQLIVLYWRGVWQAMDVHIYPGSPHHSALVSLALGYLFQAFLCLLEPHFNSLYRADNPVRRWSLETLSFFVGNFISVAHWRGVWVLLDVWVLPDSPDVSCALTHLAGIGGLWLMLCGHSVTQAGCELDGGSAPQLGCVMPNQYLRYFRVWLRRRDDDALRPPRQDSWENDDDVVDGKTMMHVKVVGADCGEKIALTPDIA